MKTKIVNPKKVDSKNITRDELLHLAKLVNFPLVIYEDRDDICPYLGSEDDTTNIQGLATWISMQTDLLKIDDINTVVEELRERLDEYFDWLIEVTSETFSYWDLYMKTQKPEYQLYM